jgi:hypothetical protein
MRMPGFTAEASTHRSNGQYHVARMTNQMTGLSGSIALAGTCACTDSSCTWSCPPPIDPPDDPCRFCEGLRGCAKRRCECECTPGGFTLPGGGPPCFFECV